MSVIGKRVIYAGPVDKGQNCHPLTVEGEAVDAFLPGTVLKQGATGLATSDTAATVAGEKLLIANKDELRSRSVDDAWTVGDTAIAIQPRSGEFFNAIVATGNNITTRGTPLARNGAGLLTIGTPATDVIVAYAEEIVNVTADALVLCSPA